jgi:HEAT repeat protein
MFSDENQDVRKGAAVAAGKFAEAVGMEGMSMFLAPLKQAMEDNKWRVRKATL